VQKLGDGVPRVLASYSGVLKEGWWGFISPMTRPTINLPFPWDVKRLEGFRLDGGFATLTPQPRALLLYPARGTCFHRLSASSEHLVLYTNDLLLWMYAAVAEIFCVCKLENIRQMCRVQGTLKS